MRCAGPAACSGRIVASTRIRRGAGARAAAKGKRVVVAKASYVLAAGQSKQVRVRLTRAGAKLLKKAGRLSVSVKVTVGGGPAVTKKITLRRSR